MRTNAFAGTAAAALLALGLANSARGDESSPTGAYVGVSAGHALFSYLEDRSNSCNDSGLCSQDAAAPMYTAYVGFEFSRHFAVEAGWIGHRALEGVAYRNPNPNFPCLLSANQRSKHSVSTIYGAAVGRMPVDAGRVAPFVKLGAYRYRAKTKHSGPCLNATASDEDIAPLVGAGADAALDGRWRMRGEWLYFGKTGGKAHAFLGGIAYRF